jgi:nucleotide-binding universal stress UspA family protein
MTLKDILVIVDETPSAEARLDVALALAADHDAHLTGLYISSPVSLPSYVESFLTEEMRASWEAEESARAVDAGARFTERLSRAGRLARSEWRVVTGATSEVAATHGRYADLVVVGQLDPAARRGVPLVEPDALVFACGRPVLVVPYVGHFPTVGRRVLVGWNGSREAARAVADAMPVLEQARLVTLLAVDTAAEQADDENEPGLGIARHLAHHGIVAEAARFICEPHEVGDTLLNYTTDLSCDLIVLGAYGQNRLRSLVLGSLTGFILEHMTVPVLLSH